MKKLRCSVKGGAWLVLSLVTLTRGRVFAQTTGSDLVPIVTVRATQPIATGTNPGVFTVFRAGNTNAPLNVWYDLGGSASNGVDYAPIPPHLAQIAAGATSNAILITPLANPSPASVARTVVLTLTNSPLMAPVNYQIGSPSSATVDIESAGVTNLPPVVRIDSPTNGATFFAPANVPIFATASASSGTALVEFFADGQDLGPGTLEFCVTPAGNCVGCPPPVLTCAYSLVWSNAPVGNHVLTALATDNNGLSSTSAPVKIAVQPGPPPTNQPPVVEISWPTNGATFFGRIVCPPCLTNNPPCELPCYFEGPNIPLCANASDPDDAVATVEFFANGRSLGIRTNCLPCASPINPFCLVWSNAPPGDYVLTAVATDTRGAASQSAPVSISVRESPATTNQPPVVRLISPANGQVFFAPVNIPLYAYGSARGLGTNGFFNQVTHVEFYADGTDLGAGQHVVYGPPPTPGGAMPNWVILLPDRFYLIWSNAPVGAHRLNAVAVDQFGNCATSAPVNLTVLPSSPPPTNRPPVVSIVATDPVAIAGTNAWVWRGQTNAAPTWATWPTAPCRFFTNCGPKTATFTVRRFGETNHDLTVPYNIGGTAGNGVDYVTLPGWVTVPAGERRVLITVVPVDNSPSDVNKTVILTLAASTNTPPDYVLGFPRRAAATIIDRPKSWPTSGMLPGPVFHAHASGPDGAWFYVQSSTDLVRWTTICTNQVIDGSIDFVDPDAASNLSRFYRAVPLPGPPSE